MSKCVVCGNIARFFYCQSCDNRLYELANEIYGRGYGELCTFQREAIKARILAEFAAAHDKEPEASND